MQGDCGYGHSRLLPTSQCFVCTDCAPESLLDLCFKYIIDHLDSICDHGPFGKTYKLKDGIIFPSEICDKFIQISQQQNRKVNDQLVAIFRDRCATRLKRVSLRNSHISDASLKILLEHKLIELDLSCCPSLTDDSLECLDKYGSSLISLSLGEGVAIIPGNLSDVRLERENLINTIQLKRFTLHRLNSDDGTVFLRLLRPMSNLTHLDLSECWDLHDMAFLHNMKYLTSLILYNVIGIEYSIQAICSVQTLRHLDISVAPSREHQGIFENENQVLSMIIKSLPQLNSLDISGTNLAGTGVAEKDCGTIPTDVPGLSVRAHNPLQFLGLYQTANGACRRHDIPALMISGDATEEQILVAAAAYVDRAEMLQRVLNDLYHLFRYETCRHIGHALSLVLQSMDRHQLEKHIQISGSATLFYVVKGKEKKSLGVRVKRHIISTLLNAMYFHMEDDTMMRNGCLTLCQFKIPLDVLFEYERLVHILLHSVSEMEQESFVQRIAIYLLNSLACQVDGRQKQRLGDLGVISKMLGLIADRLGRGVCDDVLEVAWSTMWNVTDETPLNCRRFLDAKGMEYFLGCLSSFPNKEELLRNMMGLLGNVAEVKSLRCRLMTSQYVDVFSTLLDSSSDGIEVSYNAAGVLAHMASDGPSVWTLTTPSRSAVLARMSAAIERWDLATERNINYRSFEPILHLVKTYHTPECQHWAVWALANLTKVYPAKYCSLVESEGGLTLLSELLHHEAPPSHVKQLASIVINNCRQYSKNDYLETDAQLDG